MTSEAFALEEEIIRQSSAGLQKLPMLDVFFARIPSDLSSALRSKLGLQVEVLSHVLRYESWATLAEMMQGHTLSLEAEATPWAGKSYVWMEPALLYAALELQMGGQAEGLFLPSRPPSPIERRLARGICDIACAVAAENISRVTPVTLKSGAIETLQQAATAMPGTALCAAGVIELGIGQTTGRMVILFPMATLDPVQGTLSRMFLGERLGDPTWRDHIRSNISETHVELTAVMHVFDCAMNDVLAWKPGDIVPLDLLEVPEIRLLCSGSEILYGAGGQCGDNRYAVSIEREASPSASGFQPSPPLFRSGVTAGRQDAPEGGTR